MNGETSSHLSPAPCGAFGYGRCFSIRPAAERLRLPLIRDSAKHRLQRPASDLRARSAAVTSLPESVRPVATVSFLLHISNAAATDVLQDGGRRTKIFQALMICRSSRDRNKKKPPGSYLAASIIQGRKRLLLICNRQLVESNLFVSSDSNNRRLSCPYESRIINAT